MDDSLLFDPPNRSAVKADGARIPSPAALTLPKLPSNVAMQVAELARVPAGEYERFRDDICRIVHQFWVRDRRAGSSKPGRALLKAAEAARILNEAICSLNEEDTKWIERLAAQDPYGRELPRPLLLALWRIDRLLSTAINKPLPTLPGVTVLRKKRGRRSGAVGDGIFEKLIRQLLACTAKAGGKLTFDKNSKKGTLKDVLVILRPHLPKGLVPNALPYGTIQKIKTKYSSGLRRLISLKLRHLARSSPLDQK